MKTFFSIVAILAAWHGFGQSREEIQVLRLSGDIFNWEIEKKMDALENIFQEKFVVVSGSGGTQSKEEYLIKLKGEDFIHNNINVEQDTAIVVYNTAIVVGKGKFIVTSAGSRQTLHLSYIEVFTRPNAKESWKILAMHASVLQN